MSLNVLLLRETLDRATKENGGTTALGMAFYKRLFEHYPAVRPLFTTPPEEQHKKLIASLAAIVGSLEKPERLMPYLRAMGIRHNAYKTEPQHYGAVKENLLSVLANHLKKEGDWTAEMNDAWSQALDVVSQVMIEAAGNPTKYKEELAAMGFKADGFKQNASEPWAI